MANKSGALYLPSLRGAFGDWVYYSCLMSSRDLAERVGYATDIHSSTGLSEMIQRQLKEGRTEKILDYLKKEPQRFIGSIVVAVYGGAPKWLEAGLDFSSTQVDQNKIYSSAFNSIGLLGFSGDEKLFALDGQHRLSALKKAYSENVDLGNDEVNVIFIGHKKSKAGVERTRRLFTTLNKKAVRVSKGEVIALDEDDPMAIVSRWLVERDGFFREGMIAFNATNNIPHGEAKALTTIGSLYDILSIIFPSILNEKISDLKQSSRPEDSVLELLYEESKGILSKFFSHFPELRIYMEEKEFSGVAAKYRHQDGGSVLFRPVGLRIFFEVAAASKTGFDPAFRKLKRIGTSLNEAPFVNAIWDPKRSTMVVKNATAVRDFIKADLGIIEDKKKRAAAVAKYKKLIE